MRRRCRAAVAKAGALMAILLLAVITSAALAATTASIRVYDGAGRKAAQTCRCRIAFERGHPASAGSSA
jgi:hypothetical protein